MHERCNSILSTIIPKFHQINDETIKLRETTSDCDSSSYLSMNMPKSHENVIMPMTSHETEMNNDENIYDNCFVENAKSKLNPKCEKFANENEKLYKNREFPFIGLPVAHLKLQKARKIGWLTISCQRKSFLNILYNYFRKRYYVGLMLDENYENDKNNYWLLLYTDDKNQLRPTAYIDLQLFNVGDIKTKIKQKRKHLKLTIMKFQLYETLQTNNQPKHTSSMIYTICGDKNDETEEWHSTLQLIKKEMNRSTSSAMNRELPQVPYENDVMPHKMSPIDDLLYCNQDVPNHSEGVYEDPELYNKYTSHPNQSIKINDNDDNTDPNQFYDIPKFPARPLIVSNQCNKINDIIMVNKKTIEHSDTENGTKTIDGNAIKSNVDNEDDYDKIIVDCETTGESKMCDIKHKLTKHIKDHTQRVKCNKIHKKMINENSTRHAIGPMRRIVQHIRKSTVFSLRSPKLTKRNQKIIELKTTQIDEMPENKTQTDEIGTIEKPKQGKVHMIINQLEANGQLTLLSAGVAAAANQRTPTK